MNEEPFRSIDKLYATKQDTVEAFEFNASVARVFTDMVNRSVPGYNLIVDMISILAMHHAEAIDRPLHCVDYGCSRGAVTQALAKRLTHLATRFTLLDSSQSMIDAAKDEIDDARATFCVADILEAQVDQTDIAVMNLVLQFIEPSRRLELLASVHDTLAEDGMLILTEKIEAGPEFVDFHLAFKRAAGYSDLEIKQKRDALEKVMVIDSLTKHKQRLRAAGFRRVNVWFRLLNWVSFLARP
ncbi:MAG: methyltransferase domain-containing protein [Gammaproteobacteria bacterium]|nr:methyltransferase domain-containing protein [Gammaproteobacteria bacterium]